MKKSLEKIFVVLLVSILIFSIINFNFVYASEATISVSAAKVNENFTVTVNIPSDAIAYQGKIEVKFSDGTTKNSGALANVTGITGDYAHPGNMSATFKATSSGSATIKVTGLIITSKSGSQINSQTELTKTINVEAAPAPTPTPTPTPEPPPATKPNQPTTPTTPEVKEPTWNNTGDTVYAIEKLNVRSSWSATSNKLGTLAKDASTKRIATGSNGWDKIEYNGKTAYVMSKYLTTKNPNEDETKPEEEPKWKETGDTVYALKSVNIRSGWNTSFDKVGGLKEGQTVKRIATGSNGWDKIEYNGKTAYVMSKYLTTEEPEEEDNTVNNNTADNKVNNTNEASNKALTNEEIYNQLVDDIGVIPTVGRNIVDYIYGIGVIFAIIMLSIVGLKIREKKGEE